MPEARDLKLLMNIAPKDADRAVWTGVNPESGSPHAPGVRLVWGHNKKGRQDSLSAATS